MPLPTCLHRHVIFTEAMSSSSSWAGLDEFLGFPPGTLAAHQEIGNDSSERDGKHHDPTADELAEARELNKWDVQLYEALRPSVIGEARPRLSRSGQRTL